MKKHKQIPYLRLLPLLLLAPLLYFAWEKAGTNALQEGLKNEAITEAIHLGTPAPDIISSPQHTWSKQKFQLSTFNGSPIFLHFWATWCGPCLQELPEILALSDRLRPQGFIFVTVAVDESWDVLDNFFQQHPRLAAIKDKTILVLDPEAKIAGLYKSYRFPETFLINVNQVMDNKFIGIQPWSSPAMDVYLQHLKKTEVVK